MGHEPIADTALTDGADLVLAGRVRLDAPLRAALPLLRGFPAGPVWRRREDRRVRRAVHHNLRSGGVLVTVDSIGFSIEPLDPNAACTPQTVAAHMMYENADPYRMREPAGTLDTSAATYTAIDDRRVRVEGSQFVPAAQYTVKLEGSALIGYQTIIISGMRNPAVLARIDEWCDTVLCHLHHTIPTTIGVESGQYDIQLLRYGHDAVLGAAEPHRRQPPREVGIVFVATAHDQAAATNSPSSPTQCFSTLPSAGNKPCPAMRF